jgi:hypothetical protein
LQWLIGKVFYQLALLLNKFVFALENTPYAILEGITINGMETILIYVLILLLVLLTQELRPKYTFMFLVIFSALVGYNTYEYMLQQKQESLTVYSIKGKQAIAVVRGNKIYRDFDEDLLKNESAMLFNVRHHWWAMDVQKEFKLNQLEGYAEFDFGYSFVAKGKRVLVIERLNKNVMPKTKVVADVVTISRSPKIHLQEIKKITDAPLIIADATNKTYLLKRWKNEALELNLKLHDVMKDGAITL